MPEKLTAEINGTNHLPKNETSRYKELYNNAPLPYQSLNEYGIFNDINSSWLRTLGYTRDEVIGISFRDFLHIESQPVFDEKFPLFKKRGYVSNAQFKIRHKNDSYLQIIIEGCIGYDINGDFDQTYCIFQNITEKKLLEDKILKNQYYLKKAQEIGKIGTWELNLIQNSLIWTDEIYTIFGLPLESEISYETFLNCVYPADKDYINEQWQKALNKNSYDIEHRILVNNKIKWVHEKADITFDDNGIPVSAIGFTQDITDRKEAEVELFESEQRYKTLIEISPDAIFINYNNCITFVNPAAIELFGAESSDDIIGKSPFDVFHTDYHEKISGRIKWMIDTGKSVSQIEEKIIQMNGNVIDVEVTAIPFNFNEDKAIQVILRNITDRKLTEEKLLQSEMELKKVQEITHTGSWSLDLITNEVVWSRELYKMYGFDPASSPPRYNEHSKLFTPESWQLLTNTLDQIVKSGSSYELELKIIRKDGTNGWMWVQGHALKNADGKYTSLWGAAQDITERKNAEQDLKNSEQSFNNLFTSIRDAILVADVHRKIIKCNQAFIELFGYSTSEIIGKETSFIYKDLQEYEKMGAMIKEKIKNPNFLHTIRYLKKNGDVFPGETNVFYLRNDKNEIEGFIGVIRDITEKKKAETELAGKINELERFNKIMTGRELRMLELKKEVNDLLENLNLPQKYKLPDISFDMNS